MQDYDNSLVCNGLKRFWTNLRDTCQEEVEEEDTSGQAKNEPVANVFVTY